MDKNCKHDGGTSRRFGGAVTCNLCMLIIDYWKSAQPVIPLRKTND